MNRKQAVALLLALGAQAACADVTCRVGSGLALAFGNYDLLAAVPTDSLASVVVTCGRDGGPSRVQVEVQLGPGGAGGTVVSRRLRNPAASEFLSYGLFRDPARASPWGNTSGVDTVIQSVAVPNKGTASLTFTIFGRIPPRQEVAAGVYTDAVQVTVTP